MLVNEPNFVAVEPVGLCGGCIIKLRLVGDDFREGFHGKKMVGTARFELATSCSQSRRATRLRYAP